MSEDITHKFSINKKYYTGTVYEWNIPTGHTCPYAVDCLVSVDRETGKFDNSSSKYRCYASSAERFPSARNARWRNYDYVLDGGIPEIPKKCKAVRIHMSGDFFSQKYFDMWLQVARDNPDVEFWAFTKSLRFWVKRINEIPENLALTASYGGKEDHLIEEHGLRSTRVFDPNLVRDVTHGENSKVPKDSPYRWVTLKTGGSEVFPVDTNDDWARIPFVDFCLIDNLKKLKENNE